MNAFSVKIQYLVKRNCYENESTDIHKFSRIMLHKYKSKNAKDIQA